MVQVAGGYAALEHGDVAVRATGLLPPSGVRPLRLPHVARGPMRELGFSFRPVDFRASPNLLGSGRYCVSPAQSALFARVGVICAVSVSGRQM